MEPRNNSIPRQEAGFSLFEMMVALAVMSVLGVVIFGFASSASGTFSKMRTSTEIEDSMAELRTMMAMSKQCTENFRAKSFQGLLAPQSIQLYNLTAVPITTSPVLQQGLSQSQQIDVKEMRLELKQSINNELKMSNLVVKFQKVATQEIYERSLPILFKIDPSTSKVKECWLRQDASSIQLIQACSAASEGAVVGYDPATNTCKLTNGKWYPGTSTAATCPAGTTLPRAANALYHCKAVPPAGFDDRVYYTQSNVAMASGASIPLGRAFSFSKIVPPNTCACALAVDIPQAIRDSFICQAYCVGP